jgi:hypothetical protein
MTKTEIAKEKIRKIYPNACAITWEDVSVHPDYKKVIETWLPSHNGKCYIKAGPLGDHNARTISNKWFTSENYAWRDAWETMETRILENLEN